MNQNDMNEFIKQVAFLIKKEREQNKVSQSYIANHMNISESYYRHLERASTMQVSLYKYARMAQLIQMPLSSAIQCVENKKVDLDKATYQIYYSKLQNEYDLDNYIIEIGNVLRKIRKDKHKSQKAIGGILGSTSHYYGYIERGEHKAISLYRYKVIATSLDTPLHVILQQAEKNLDIE